MNTKLTYALNEITKFSEEELKLIEPFFKLSKLDKNEILLEEGQICNTFFWVESGVLRTYYNNNGLDVNLNFTFENQFTINFESYTSHEPSKTIIQAMEKSDVWIVNARGFVKEYGSSTTFTTFIRRLAISLLLATEEHHNMMRMNTPAERYQFIVERKPEFIQRLSLTHLASYIGITRETLSRIRSNKY